MARKTVCRWAFVAAVSMFAGCGGGSSSSGASTTESTTTTTTEPTVADTSSNVSVRTWLTTTTTTTTTSTTTTTTTTVPPPPTEPPNSPSMTLAEFEQLHPGMTYEASVAIIGGPGELITESQIAGFHTIMYAWDGEGQLGANANVMFQNGKLVTKAQYGLR